jgi:hypothetical protein
MSMAQKRPLGLFYNDSTAATLYVENLSTTNSSLVFEVEGNVGHRLIDVKGYLTCTGSESAVVPAVEATENWFEDAGSAQLSHGSARIDLDPTFAQTVNTAIDYHVFLTPNGDCKGLYVSQKSATSFEVHELGGGTSNIAFDYRIMAKRGGHESLRLADFTERYNALKVQREKRRLRSSALRSARPCKRPSDSEAGRTLHPALILRRAPLSAWLGKVASPHTLSPEPPPNMEFQVKRGRKLTSTPAAPFRTLP